MPIDERRGEPGLSGRCDPTKQWAFTGVWADASSRRTLVCRPLGGRKGRTDMRPALVRLVDLGFDTDFDISMSFAQSIVQSLGARSDGNPVAEVEFIRTRDESTVTAALQTRAAVLHVTAHGETDPDQVGFWSDDGESGLTLTTRAESFHDDGCGIEADTVFADCCATSQGRFVKAVRNCIPRTDHVHRCEAHDHMARVDDVRVGVLRRFL
jgi:hypothetical protein